MDGVVQPGVARGTELQEKSDGTYHREPYGKYGNPEGTRLLALRDTLFNGHYEPPNVLSYIIYH